MFPYQLFLTIYEFCYICQTVYKQFGREMEEFKVPGLPGAPGEKESTESIGTTDDTNTETESIEETHSANGNSNVKSKSQPDCPYSEPEWSAPPSDANIMPYKFEVLKSGQIIEEIKNLQEKAVWKFGRLPSNDMELAHPTISRFHAILQYRPKTVTPIADDPSTIDANKPVIAEGWYIYDLGSTHGTFLNKQRIPPKTYIRIKVGHILRLGASTRNYILQGPIDDEEPESEFTVTELRSQRQRQEEAQAVEAQRQAEAREREGINWGMTEDADEESDLSVNPYASTNNEELFLDDPKRTLRGFFEREGLTLEYKCDEMSAGSFVCRVELPLDDNNGRPIVAEVIHKGRKKECVVQCALEACRILDRAGVLRQANQEPLKRKGKTEPSDDDDDDFWDRTGDVERKKMRKANTSADITLTYEDLLKQETELLAESEKINKEIEKYQDHQKRIKATKVESSSEDVDLDCYMKNLNEDTKPLDKTEIRKLRTEQQRLHMEHQKVQRLLRVAKPVDLPFSKSTNDNFVNPEIKHTAIKKQMPMIGKRNQFSKLKIIKPTTTKNAVEDIRKRNVLSDEEELEEDVEEIIKAPTNEYLDENIPSEKTKKKESTEDSLCEETTLESNSTYANISNTPKEDVKSVSVTLDSDLRTTKDDDQLNNDHASTAAAKKRHRHRQRMRNKRAEIDIDELATHESIEKYAKWVPPDNQTGDGITKLNEKFGY